MKAFDQVLGNCGKLRKFIAIDNRKLAEEAACGIIKNIFEKAPILGIDLDGVIDEAPQFFSMLSNIWPGLVYIVTCRDDQEKAENYARSHDINFDKLVMVNRLNDKATVIQQLGVNVYIDDQDECLLNIPDTVKVMKFRNGGNFDSNTRKWFYSSDTGEKI